jgi:hypothetical protein
MRSAFPFRSYLEYAGTIFGALLLLSAADARAHNLHLIDQRQNGYAIYRSGVPDAADFSAWCSLGIREVMVLSGDADRRERAFSYLCPELKVFYNRTQDPQVPVTAVFLRRFDTWVRIAKREGKKILFRCTCGCHRTGRLAAYYEMKYMSYSFRRARRDMYRFGENMDYYPFLFLQVRALQDYIAGRPCRQARQYCVKE